MGTALQIWSAIFSKAFDSLPASVREAVREKIDEMGTRLATFPQKRLTGRSEFKLRISDYRVLYEFAARIGRIDLHYVVIAEKSTNEIDSRDLAYSVSLS